MPARNVIKQYVENGVYHIYNRGVEKRTIFMDAQDYAVFLSYLKTYLTPKDRQKLLVERANPDLSAEEKNKISSLLRLNNFHGEIQLFAYCLMPNHFHLLIKQQSATGMTLFTNSLLTRYTMYFNRRYKRVGRLYQGIYKAILVQNDAQLLELTRYIHRNPLDLSSKEQSLHKLLSYQYSSLPDYLGMRTTTWVVTKEINSFFSKKYPSLTYEAFIKESEDREIIAPLLIEE